MVECHSCGRPAGYNRAVVDVHSTAELGGLCVECERDAFGRILEVGAWTGSDACALCPRDGHYALPTWDPERVEEAGRVVNRVEYEVDASTPTLCDEHLARLLGTPDSPSTTAQRRQQR